jgi:hypothetical protein
MSEILESLNTSRARLLLRSVPTSAFLAKGRAREVAVPSL